MAFDFTTVKTELENRRYPAILNDAEWASVVAAAMREFNRYRPITSFASFTTVAEQQNYNIFDPLDTNTNGFAQNALEITDIYWNPGGDWSSLNLFSPGWQMLSQVLLYTGSYFHNPSQILVLRSKLNDWKREFGSQGWEVVGQMGDPSAYLKIFPIPLEGGSPVVVEFTGAISVDTLSVANQVYFYQWAEAMAAEAIANTFANTAGVNVLGFTDSKEACRYWETKAERLRQKATDTQAGPQGSADRS